MYKHQRISDISILFVTARTEEELSKAFNEVLYKTVSDFDRRNKFIVFQGAEYQAGIEAKAEDNFQNLSKGVIPAGNYTFLEIENWPKHEDKIDEYWKAMESIPGQDSKRPRFFRYKALRRLELNVPTLDENGNGNHNKDKKK